ncbi:MAG: Asp-tRNA(Asn)/Glu-tRNA(Gln) amidotransferase GatCAB subunit B, partial [Clostridiales bacterium]|nr:Asp-tRNA(Asn)/Glu-tRNA(Gln) amidotransferase GatCAB subunit B [Clostridiales bacterium]
SMRSKENAQDYRYFPEPDIPPMELSEDYLAGLRSGLPEMAQARQQRYVREFGLPEYDAGLLTGTRALADFFEATVALGVPPKEVSNWMMAELLRTLKEKGMEAKDMALTPGTLAAIIQMVSDGKLNRSTASQVFSAVFDDDADPAAYVKAHGLEQISDAGLVEETVKTVLAANAAQVAEYRSGKQKVFGFLVGQCMRALKGKADPKVVNRTLREQLDG